MRFFSGLFLFFIALALPLSAANLNFVVVETGAPGDSSGEVTNGTFSASSLWEDSFLDVFFEAGHIISNAPVLRMDKLGNDFPGQENPHKAFPQELNVELEDAEAGGADFFILALLAYPPGSADRKTKPERVSLRVYKTRPFGLVYEGNSALAPAQRQEDEGERAKRLIRGLIPHLKDEV
jgi:hypothetical protein